MLFLEALKLMEESAPMCRESWSLDEGYVTQMPGMKYIWKIVLNPNPNAGNFIFAVEDFLASDWKKFEMPAVPIEVPAVSEAA